MPTFRLHALLLAAALASVAATGNCAADPPPAAAQAVRKPGCAAPEYRQFDFWLGDWDTFEADDPKTAIARTHVDPIAAGCAVHELYEQADGRAGIPV